MGGSAAHAFLLAKSGRPDFARRHGHEARDDILLSKLPIASVATHVLLHCNNFWEVEVPLLESIQWSAIEAVAGAATTVIAWLVYLEARSIKQLQWLSQAADKWQEFNRLLIETKQSDRWETLRSGREISPPLTPTDKRLMLMYFNIQMVEYHLIQKNIVPHSALTTMKAELTGFKAHANFVTRVLDEGGYDPDYVAFVKAAWT